MQMDHCVPGYSMPGGNGDALPVKGNEKRRMTASKTVLIMKMMSFLMLVACLQVQARGLAQLVSFSGKNVSLVKIFAEVKKQTGYVFFYEEDVLKGTHPVSVNAVKMPLDNFLDEALKDQPLEYAFQNKTIVISAKAKKLNAENLLQASGPTTEEEKSLLEVKGRILDEEGNPVVASVMILGTKNGASSNAEGYFSIQNVEEMAVLQVTAINIESRDVKLNGRSFVNITVRNKVVEGDDVVINAGYYSVKAREATGSISTVTAKTIEKQPVTNVLTAAAGRMPGVQILQQSGLPGGGISVQIRAANSLLTGVDPLYIIDGVPYLSEPVYSAGGATNGNLRPSYGNSPLNMLNPNDIESITVLKDADATAIYGSRGANGVVLITSKKAKTGKPRFDYNVSSGLSWVADLHRVKTLTLAQHLEMRNQAYRNTTLGRTPTTSNSPDLLLWDTTRATDFEKIFFGGKANFTDASASFSAGNSNVNMLMSATYHRENAVIPGDFNYQRGGIRMIAGYHSTDNRFNVKFGATYNVDRNTGNATVGALGDLANVAFKYPINYPIYNADGSLYWLPTGSNTYQNPMSYKYQVYTGKNDNLLGNIGLSYRVFKQLSLKVDASYNRLNLEQTNFMYSGAFNPGSTTKPSATYQNNYTKTWNLEPTAEYLENIGKGKLSVLAGMTFQSSEYVQPYYISASDFSSDALLKNYTSAGSYRVYSYNNAYKYNSVFGRLNYNWDRKYILNLNYRWDASSKFGYDNRTGSFGSVGAAYILSEEKFWKDNINFISFAKFRGSYGTSGNDQIGAYQFTDNYATTSYQYDNVAGLIPANLANPKLGWEVNKKLEIAAEFGFFKDRINVSGAWFRNRTDNPLVRAPRSTVTGFTYFLGNIGATIETMGTEFSLNTVNVRGKNFRWETNFNISFPKSKLTAFNDIENTTYINNKIVGSSLADIYGYQYTGIEKATGLPQVRDADGNGSTTDWLTGLAAYGRGDLVKIGNTDADFYGGLNNTLSYKGLHLDVFFQFVGRRMIPGLANYNYTTAPPGYGPLNTTQTYYDLYKETGGKIATVDNSYTETSAISRWYLYANSSATISNAAFIRLKNVALTYDIPLNWVSKLKMQKASVFVQGQNLFTATKFEGFDPETQANNIPPLTNVVFGIRGNF